jgi:hypothetical protein
MALSEEATRRFTEYVEQSDMSDTSFGHDVGLLNFTAWALVHDPTALRESFALDRIMTQRSGASENKMRSVHAVLGAAHPLIVAYERELAISDTRAVDQMVPDRSARPPSPA